MKLFNIKALSTLRGNMGSDHFRVLAGVKSSKPSRASIVAEKNRQEKAETAKASLAKLRERLFPVRPFVRVAAVRQVGKFSFKPVAGFGGRTFSDVTRKEMEIGLRLAGFTGYRFVGKYRTQDGKRVFALN